MYPALAMTNEPGNNTQPGGMPPDSAAVIAYYTRLPETERLTARAGGALEFARTQELLLRHLPPAPATVLDVGGGTGPYARWLAGLGYRVCLLDLVLVHVKEAVRAAAAGSIAAGAALGNALHLPFADAAADAVLLLGPLYHLTERTERLSALREARRVLKPGGRVCAVGVSRFASLIDGLHFALLDDAEYQAIVRRDLRDGQHRGAVENDYWTTAYLHRPEELAQEVEEVGFALRDHVAIEGPFRVLPDLDAWWNDAARRERLLDAIRAVEHEPSLLGVSSHVLVVGERS